MTPNFMVLMTPYLSQGPNNPTSQGPNDPLSQGPNDPTSQGPNDPLSQGPNNPTSQGPNDAGDVSIDEGGFQLTCGGHVTPPTTNLVMATVLSTVISNSYNLQLNLTVISYSYILQLYPTYTYNRYVLNLHLTVYPPFTFNSYILHLHLTVICFIYHLRFKQAQLKMCHSPKVEDVVKNKCCTLWTHIFSI